MIHQALVDCGGQFTGGIHPPNQFVTEIVSPLPCLPAHVRHTLLIVYFFKELISFIGFLDKHHTSVFNALIYLFITYMCNDTMRCTDESEKYPFRFYLCKLYFKCFN